MWLSNTKKKGIFFTFFVIFCLNFIFVLDLHAGSIVLKVIAVNPSKEQSQKVPFKIYLPKEAKPEDLIDRADLEPSYDTQQGSYFLAGEYELKPGEVLDRNIEIRDIWVIEDTEIEFLRAEAVKLCGLLKNSEYSERAAYLASGIESKLNYINENQKNAPANPERHISDYRENLKVVEAVKADLALIRGLLSQVKSFPAASAWKIIVAILIFLGLMSLAFYFLFKKQLKTITTDTFYVPKEDQSAEEKSAQANIPEKDSK